MSSTSSCCNQDINCDSDDERFLSDDLVTDIERFAAYAERLRRSLDSTTVVPEGESKCVCVHSALSMVSQSVRDLLVRYPIFKTSQVLLPASQLVHSVKELNFDNSNVDASRTLSCLEKLEAAVGNTLKQSLRHPVSSKLSTATLGRRTKNSIDGGVKNGRVLTRRHSTYQQSSPQNEFNIDEMDRMVVNRPDGIDIAFDRSKAWSKYCKELLNFVSRRMQLELDHAKKVHTLATQSKIAINEHFLPLRNVFESSFDNDVVFCEHTYDAVKHIQDRFIKSLEMRRDEHERQRRVLKNEWMRVTKQVKDTQQELLRARSLLGSRDDGYRRAQESFLRTESTGPAVGAEIIRRKKELERRRRNEEEAFTKREEAQNQVDKLENELERREQFMEDTKVRIVAELRELVYRCDQTTKACSTHYFQALSNLWISLPGKYQDFADATRTYTPGNEYMSFLQNLPHRTASSGSLFRAENDECLSLINNPTVTTASSSSVSSQRRNAIDILDHEILPERKKKSNVRLSDQSAIESPTQSDAAKSHSLQRIRQPTKCAHCDTLSILSTVQCVRCGIVWHKSCLTRITLYCDDDDDDRQQQQHQSAAKVAATDPSSSSPSSSSGAAAAAAAAAAARRMSIFGVALKTHLNDQQRLVPLILEKCIDELQRRGLKVKGIYRTCGVKSKIEQICEEFERCPNFVNVDLSLFHPMNIASVVKLYLRKLPEPLLTYELYNEWISLARRNISDEDTFLIEQVRDLLKKLPFQNYDTLQYLLLHLNRVTWFEVDNLMTASNLGAVISPSMIWAYPYTPSCSNSSFLSDAHLLSKTLELLIKNAFEIFNIDRAEDWRNFFQTYPDIEQPPAVDPEIEAQIDDDEGLEEEEDDLLEDDTDVLCASFVPQPPTPDLLKNTTSRCKNESYSTMDDIDFDNSLASISGGSGSGGSGSGYTAAAAAAAACATHTTTTTTTDHPRYHHSGGGGGGGGGGSSSSGSGSGGSVLLIRNTTTAAMHMPVQFTLSTPIQRRISSSTDDMATAAIAAAAADGTENNNNNNNGSTSSSSSSRRFISQKRSYTTSILVSPKFNIEGGNGSGGSGNRCGGDGCGGGGGNRCGGGDGDGYGCGEKNDKNDTNDDDDGGDSSGGGGGGGGGGDSQRQEEHQSSPPPHNIDTGNGGGGKEHILICRSSNDDDDDDGKRTTTTTTVSSNEEIGDGLRTDKTLMMTMMMMRRRENVDGNSGSMLSMQQQQHEYHPQHHHQHHYHHRYPPLAAAAAAAAHPSSHHRTLDNNSSKTQAPPPPTTTTTPTNISLQSVGVVLNDADVSYV